MLPMKCHYSKSSIKDITLLLLNSIVSFSGYGDKSDMIIDMSPLLDGNISSKKGLCVLFK